MTNERIPVCREKAKPELLVFLKEAGFDLSTLKTENKSFFFGGKTTIEIPTHFTVKSKRGNNITISGEHNGNNYTLKYSETKGIISKETFEHSDTPKPKVNETLKITP